MADGFTRAGGGTGTALMVPGPGLQNASAAIGTAYAASSPMLVVCGQIERDLIGVDRGILHEVNDQLDTIRPVTKWAKRILDPAEIPDAVHEAFYHLKTGRPRPVEIEIPPETLADMADVELREPEEYPRQAPDPEAIRVGAQIMAEAENPLIWAGGGVISSGAPRRLDAGGGILAGAYYHVPGGQGGHFRAAPAGPGRAPPAQRPGGAGGAELRRDSGRGNAPGQPRLAGRAKSCPD